MYSPARYSAIVLSLGSLLAGCGGGGSGTAGTTTTTLSGTFVDAPTNGLSYAASPSGLSGITSGSGNYSYRAGDTVTFTLATGGTPITIGSSKPEAPSGGGNAQTFVLSLNNGQQVAQVLQALNHGSAATMDVSGLTIPSATVSALNSYVSSGGVALPAGQTDIQLLTSAQGGTTLSSGSAPSFAVPVTGTFKTTVLANLQSTLSTLSSSASSAISLGTLLPGKVTFHQGITTGGTDFGIDYFKTDGSISAVSANLNNSINTGSPTYTTNGNVLVISNTGITDTITVSYLDSTQGLWSDSSSDGTTGAGSYSFLQPLTPAAIAGKTLSISGSLGQCGDIPFQLVISADGASFTSNCQGGAVGSKGHGTVAANSTLPGTLTFTDSGGDIHHVGLVSGTVANGSIAVIEPGGTQNGISGITAQ